MSSRFKNPLWWLSPRQHACASALKTRLTWSSGQNSFKNSWRVLPPEGTARCPVPLCNQLSRTQMGGVKFAGSHFLKGPLSHRSDECRARTHAVHQNIRFSQVPSRDASQSARDARAFCRTWATALRQSDWPPASR